MILFPQSAVNSDKISSNFVILTYVQSHLYNCSIYSDVVLKGNFSHNFPALCGVCRGVRYLTPEGIRRQNSKRQKPQTSGQGAEVS